MSSYFKFFIAHGFLLICCTATFAGQYARVSPDLELYYNETGSGRPLIFVTGWTGANEAFA